MRPDPEAIGAARLGLSDSADTRGPGACKGVRSGCNGVRGVSEAADSTTSPAPMGGRHAVRHHEAMNLPTSPLPSHGLPKADRGPHESGSFQRVRASAWEPGASRGASRTLIGVCGAALVGALAIAGVLLSPSRPVPHRPAVAAADATAVTPASTDTPTALAEREPPAAGVQSPAPAASAEGGAPPSDPPR